MLGILDWGIGGISIYKLAKAKLGGLPIVYFSDTGATPYGKMSRSELVSRLDLVIEFLKAKGVTHLIIGCNAASTTLPYLSDHDINIEGVIESAAKVCEKIKPEKLGLIGGRRTVLSGVYRNALAKRGIKVTPRIAQPLSGLIESGDVTSDRLRSEAKRILSPLRNCSHILLACTHYPAIRSVLAEYVSETTDFIDPADALVARISKWKVGTEGKDGFFTTGDKTQMQRSAQLAFGVKVAEVKKVEL